MGTRRASDHQKRTRVQHHVKDTPAARDLLGREPDLGDKLELAHKFARRRLRTFAEEIPQAFMVRFGASKQIITGGEILAKMNSTQLPEEEPGSIPWEGGEENKGDEPGETPDPHKVKEIVTDAQAQIIESEKLEERDEAEDDY